MPDIETMGSIRTLKEQPVKPFTDKAPGWIVQKFGGTSLGKFPEEVADIIRYVCMFADQKNLLY